MRRTLEQMIDAISRHRDGDSVTRRIRQSIELRRTRTVPGERTFLAGLVDAISGRNDAHGSIRHLALRKQRRR